MLFNLHHKRIILFHCLSKLGGISKSLVTVAFGAYFCTPRKKSTSPIMYRVNTEICFFWPHIPAPYYIIGQTNLSYNFTNTTKQTPPKTIVLQKSSTSNYNKVWLKTPKKYHKVKIINL